MHWSKEPAYKKRRAKLKRERDGEFTGGKVWEKNKVLAHRLCCQVCKSLYKAKNKKLMNQHIHHIFPRRWIESPHDQINLISLCAGCHALATHAETRLFRGDLLGWWAELREYRWTKELVFGPALHYKLNEVIKLLERE